MAARTFIRDTIIIDKDVQDFYNNFDGEGPVILLGREVRHAPGKNLVLSGRPLLIIADHYDCLDGMIDARGAHSTAPGAQGTNGRFPGLIGDRPAGPGEDGGAGGAGGAGGPGTSVTLLCRKATNVHVRTTGGNGAAGGNGGRGGRGVDGFFVPSEDPENPGDEIVAGTRGGFGGPGGSGGDGGVGGELVFMGEQTPEVAVLEAGGGLGGPGGFGGQAGEDGRFTNELACPDGDPGCRGPSGASGSFPEGPFPAISIVSEEDFDIEVTLTLDSLADEWAEHRARVGEYFFRKHNTALPDRRHFARLAAHEFYAALHLHGGTALALQQQRLLAGVDPGTFPFLIGGNLNPLGLARDLDLIPRFEAYIDAFARFGALTLDFLTLGASALLSATELAVLRSFVELRQAEVSAMLAEARDDLEISKTARQLSVDEAALVRRRLDDVKREIEASMPQMTTQGFDIGDVVGTVAVVAAAVVGVIGAVFTGGASLVALAPAFVALTNAIIAEAGPAARAVFAGDAAELKRVEETYKKVGKNIDAVVNATQSVVNFVNVVQRIGAGSRPQNAPQVALVKKGVELAHELLLAQNRVILADQRTDAVQARLKRATELDALALAVANSIDENATSVRAAGLLAIEAARSKVDLLLTFAFQAQRSLEIYTLEDHDADVLYDAGSVHPDTARGYAEGLVSNADLLVELTASWALLLEPADMQSDFLAFFSNPELDSDVLRLSFRERAFLDALHSTGAATFRLEPEDLPAERFDTKVLGVAVALVDATSPDGVISTEIEHLGRYEQRRRDGSINTQFLRPRRSTRLATTRRLELPGVDFSADPPLTAPQQLAFWGRGVGGEWALRIPPDQSGADEIDLSGLTEVQLWIKYQFMR